MTQGESKFSVPLADRPARFASYVCAALAITHLAGCSTPAPRALPSTPPQQSQQALDPVRLNVGNLIDMPAPDARFDTDAEPLFRLLVAEFAGQRGRMDVAVNHYLESARQIPDLEIAKRATRIAVFARNNQAALEAAQIWVDQAPSDVEARQILAAMQIRQGDADAAITHLEYVLSADAEGASRQLRMIANLLSREEDKQTALAVMERLMANHAGDTDALLAYALLAIRAEDMPRAQGAMQKLSARGKTDTNMAMAYVALLQKQEKSNEAATWLKQAIATQPDESGLRLIYARLLADSNRYEEARIQFSIVAKKTPDNSDVVYALGLLNLQANRIDDAADNFQQLLALEARADDAHYYLAQIAESREDANLALEHYRAMTGGPNYFPAQLRIALVYSLLGKVDDAKRLLANLNPENEAQRLNIVRAHGEILTQHERFDEALAVYNEALREAYDMDLLYTRAMLGEKMGRLDVLEADLLSIIEHEPNNAQALNALGYTLADHTVRYEEAYAYIKRAFELNPDDFYILDSMGWVLYRLGRFGEAVEFLNRARRLKDDPEVAAHLGEVLWVMGDKDAARDIWNTALQGTPRDQRLLDVIERLTP